MFINFEQFNEAISLKDAKKYTKIWQTSKMQNYLSDWFGEEHRKYLPIESETTNIKFDKLLFNKIKNILLENEYEIESYVSNLCKKIGTDKNFTKITKILQKLDPKLLIDFQNELIKIGENSGYMVVISRHPVDIAGMTTGRNWKGCMDIKNGEFKKYVQVDIKLGTIIAYLIKTDDKNIQNPLSRLLIKPYVDENNKSWLFPERVFGTPNQYFVVTVEKWLNDMQGEKPFGAYTLKSGLYNDNILKKIVQSPDIMTFTSENNIDEYIVNDDNSIDIVGNLVYDMNISGELPIQINSISGYFDCVNCVSFKNFPKIVNTLILENLQTRNLVGLPKTINELLQIKTNQKISLKGLPIDLENLELVGNFVDFEYLSKIEKINDLFCQFLKFENLSMLPKIGNSFRFLKCNITTTNGLSNSKILNDLELIDCGLTELVDMPKTLNGYFDVSQNNLKSINNYPKSKYIYD